MNMILFEGRKEDSYKKYQKSIDAERKMISTYMDNASAYDFIVDEPFMKETNYKYLNDFLEHFYTVNEYSGEAEPLTRDPARDMLFGIRNQIEKIIGFLEIYEKHKSKFKYPELRQYLPYLEEFVQEAKKVKDEVESKQLEKVAKKEVDKIYETNSFLIVKPKSYQSSCYYGAGTTWCTTMKGQPSYFNDYNSKGTLFYLILKNADRNNKFYKMAIYTPKNKNFELASMWYDSHDNRMSDREKESVMAHMPKEAYDKMVDNYKSSFPEENPIDFIYGIMPDVNQSLKTTYKFKGGELNLAIDSPEIEDTDTNSLRISSTWGISELRNGEEVYNESGAIDCYLEPYTNQVLLPNYYIVKIDYEIIPYSDTKIVERYDGTTTLRLDTERKNDPEYVKMQLNGILSSIFDNFRNKMEYRLRNDENLLEKYPPTKAKSYTMSNYTFTGKGTLRQGKSGLVKGPNFDKFYKKIFE